jgi:lipopolysaccharide transport system permease protein
MHTVDLESYENIMPTNSINKSHSSTMLALTDIKDGIKSWRIWLLLSWQDIRLRYRRSTLGPFWITLSMAITIFTTGFLYGKLLKIDLHQYYPFFAVGMLMWSFISTSITEGTRIFVDSENFLKQMKQPYSTFIFRTVSRNFIIFLHNSIIFIPIIIFLHLKVNLIMMLSLFGLFLMLLNALTFGMVLAIFGTRYRDITQLITSLVQVIFFLTPIMWSAAVLPERYHYAVNWNPVAQFIEMVRNPLLGILPSVHAIVMTLLITVFSLVFGFYIFAKYRARIAYWL